MALVFRWSVFYTLLLTIHLSAEASSCDDRASRNLAADAKLQFLEQYQGEVMWSQIRIDSCEIGSIERSLGEAMPKVDRAIQCGVVLMGPKADARYLAIDLLNMNSTYIKVDGWFTAATYVPLCLDPY